MALTHRLQAFEAVDWANISLFPEELGVGCNVCRRWENWAQSSQCGAGVLDGKLFLQRADTEEPTLRLQLDGQWGRGAGQDTVLIVNQDCQPQHGT